MSSGFAKVSQDELFGGCVSAVDGFFQAITCPTVSEVSNQTSYYSCHYENFGLNCQAVCTHNLTFIYFRVVAPGSTSDIIAISKTDNLMDEIRKLAPGRFLIGDAAYELTEHLLTPFTGSQQLDLLKSKISRTDRQTFRPRFRWEMLIHICISPRHWKDASEEKRSLESDNLYVLLSLETQVYKYIYVIVDHWFFWVTG